MCVTVNAGNLHEGNTQTHCSVIKPTIMLQISIAVISPQKYIAVHIWEDVLENNIPLVFLFTKIILWISYQDFHTEIVKNRCSKSIKKKSFLEQSGRTLSFRYENIYVVYFHNQYITLTAIEVKIYICILKPCLLNICSYNWHGQANKEDNWFFQSSNLVCKYFLISLRFLWCNWSILWLLLWYHYNNIE